MASEDNTKTEREKEDDLLRGWEPASPPNVGNVNENRGIARRTFTRAEMLRIQNQWDSYEHQSMRDEVAYSEENEGGVIRAVGRLWTRYRKRAQQEELKRQVEEQKYLIQLEAQRIRSEQEIQQIQRESRRKSAGEDDEDVTDAAPKHYREQLEASNEQLNAMAADIALGDATPTGSGHGMSVQFNIKHISQPKTAQEEMISDVTIQEEPPSKYPFSPYILSKEAMIKIAGRALPMSLIFSKWTRLYSLARDGDSFDAMLRLVKGRDKTLLVIRSTKGDVFGGFADTAWEVQHHSQHGGGFYGGGQSVLFQVVKNSSSPEEDVKVYKWTGLNRFCQICDQDKKMLAMGGGGKDGAFGLCIQDDFRIGSTGRCETFGNEPLLSSGGESFDILDVEVWGFLLSVF